ncbi:VanZ family protein [Microbacterium rhizophilus]|uniref:VanZ family protein n=1 Tax=Microbacterium rhizophilus TaxID=3138934 RepID=UPI0031F12687
MTDIALGPRPPRSYARLWVSTVLLVIYVSFVSLITLWPDPSDLEFGSLADRVLPILYRFGVPRRFGFDELEFTANVGMFVPLGFLVGLALSRRLWWLALLILPAYSGFIEYTQGAALESRVSSMTDVLANTSGGYLGVLLAMIMRALIYARDRRVIERAIWERDEERIREREASQASRKPARDQGASAVFGDVWQDTGAAPTQRLPF